ncbi:hypothetical protein chiPu_0031169, partial [Chiloscyllium punctatum]|nr:hypothetical protein [Chiloscyllium punctatum]
MADRAAHCAGAVTIGAARDRRLVDAADVALPRAVTGRMAICAARMGQDLAELGEDRSGALLDILDPGKAFRRGEGVACALRRCVAGAQAGRESRQHRN